MKRCSIALHLHPPPSAQQDYETLELTVTGTTSTSKNMMIDSLKEKRLNAVASQLAQIIKVQKSEKHNIIRSSLEELVQSSSFTSDECKHITNLAKNFTKENNEKADGSAKKATTSSSSSLSLWDHLATPFSERVFWKHIEEAPNQDEKLDLLSKVDHVDDILPDWSRVCQVLQKGLMSRENNKIEYVTLSKKLFCQCQATPEYQTVRQDLCNNLLDVLQNDSDFAGGEELKIEHAYFCQLLRTWKFCWLSIIQSGVYEEESVDTMVVKALLSMQTITNSEGKSLLPGHWLALLDPDMDWWRFWLEESSVPRILAVLSSAPSIISEIWNRCQTRGAGQNTTILLSTTQWEKLIYRQSLATFSLILIHTRVRMFPWDLMDEDFKKLNLMQPLVLSTTRRFNPSTSNEKPRWIIKEFKLGAKAFPTNQNLQFYLKQALKSLSTTLA